MGSRLIVWLVLVVGAFSLACACRIPLPTTYKLTFVELLFGGIVSAFFMTMTVAGLASFWAVYRFESFVEIARPLAASFALALTIWLWPVLLSFVVYDRDLTLQGWFGISTGLSVAFIAVANGFFLFVRRK